MINRDRYENCLIVQKESEGNKGSHFGAWDIWEEVEEIPEAPGNCGHR